MKKILNDYYRLIKPGNYICALLLVVYIFPSFAIGQNHKHDDPYSKANMAFRGFFSESRAELMEQEGPFIILIGDNLILDHNSKRDTQVIAPQLYHDLKVVSHVPFAVYISLLNEQDTALSKKKEAQLIEFKGLAQEILNHVPQRSFPTDLISIQEDLLNKSIGFIDHVLKQRSVKRDELLSFIRNNREHIDLNTQKAAQVQLDLMLVVMNNWFEHMTEAEKKATRVILSGPKCCRTRALSTQFFSKYLNVIGEGDRVFYVESIYDEKRLLSAVGTYLISEKVGRDIFQNPHHMHEDLLGQSAEDYLKKMKF